jgi:hypothetical protein
MKLYHYTTFANFCSIWESNTLRFSYSKNTNDYFEREKSFVYSQGEFAKKEKVWGYLSFETIRNLVTAELEKYRQISFCLDYSKKIPGYASPMMWGQYARSKEDDGKWQDGVCIELDSEMLDRPSNFIFEHRINYPIKVKSPYLHRVDFTRENAAERFVVKYRNMLFFTKHKHWEHEREYRFVSKFEDEIGIANAITGLYVLGFNSPILNRIEEVVKDDSLINFLIITGTEDRILESINLKWYRDTLELMKQMNEGNKQSEGQIPK